MNELTPPRRLIAPTALGVVLGRREYEVRPAVVPDDLSDRVEVRLTATPSAVRAGEDVTLRLSFTPRAGAESTDPILGFVAHAGPMLRLVVTDADGAPVDPPPGPGEQLPRPGPPCAVGVALGPGAELFHELRWAAVARQWVAVSEEEAGPPPPGCQTSGPQWVNRPAGPLPAGRYAARIGTTFDYAAFGLEEPTATFDVVAE